MMQKIFLWWVLFFAQIVGASALSFGELPNSLFIKNEINYKRGVSQNLRVMANGQQIGLVQLAPNKNGTFYCFDDQNQLQNTIVLKRKEGNYCVMTLHFDILNQFQEKIAHLALNTSRLSGIVTSFTLFADDEKTVKLYGLADSVSKTPIWVTTENNYFSNHKLTKIARNLMNTDSTIYILDKVGLAATGVDVNVFNTLLAVSYMPTRALKVD